jgi:uncharacterized repeat protein (TIGR03843 family)
VEASGGAAARRPDRDEREGADQGCDPARGAPAGVPVTIPLSVPFGGSTEDPPATAAEPASLDVDGALELLRAGTIEVAGRLVGASNATLYCSISADGLTAACVYKPVRGERPLWDFPDGTLADREAAAYAVSAASRWQVVPPTVLRDGPFGAGMVQLWMDGDETVDLTGLVRADRPPLRRMAVFDAVINNADRKGGHLIPMPGGHIYGVDHGVSFHSQDKLRTVLWSWAGDPLPDEAVDVLSELRAQLEGPLADTLRTLLTRREVLATVHRVDRLLHARCYPEPSDEWPAVPWPPF